MLCLGPYHGDNNKEDMTPHVHTYKHTYYGRIKTRNGVVLYTGCVVHNYLIKVMLSNYVLIGLAC